MKERLLLVDGHGLLYRMFFGMPNKILGVNDIPIQGVVGFVGALIRALNFTKPQYVLIVFDSENMNFRDELDNEYKQNRIRDFSNVEDDKNPFTQLPMIKLALETMGLRYCEIDTFEADDVIASYTFHYQEQLDISIFTSDSDFYQVVNHGVHIFNYRGKNSFYIDEDDVSRKLGILPAQVPDFKSLTGDSSDNIKGVPGIGIKTAQYLLTEYVDIEGIYSSIEKVKSNKIRNSLIEWEDRVRHNYTLIKLKENVPDIMPLNALKMSLDDIQYKTTDILKKAKISK